MIKKNDVVTGKVISYTAEGAGVVKKDGYPIFVPFTAEGDEGEFLVVKAGKSFGYGIIKSLTKKNCDGIISIPMFGKVNSLNASVACGVVVYEAVRQRLKKG